MKPPSRGKGKAPPKVDVIVESARWKAEPRAAGIVRKAVNAAARAASTPSAELAIVLTNDSAIRALNRQWRGLDKPTNVLSFPSQAPAADPANSRQPRHIGDIVIAYETLAREAKAEGKPLRDHLSHLAVHGFLHLVGYDHGTARDAKAMEQLEIRILAGLDLPNPYTDRRSP
jgi:probable rRNA maturation factor